jgi:hypothetical protein
MRVESPEYSSVERYVYVEGTEQAAALRVVTEQNRSKQVNTSFTSDHVNTHCNDPVYSHNTFHNVRISCASRNTNSTYVCLQHVTEKYTRAIRNPFQPDSLVRLAIQSLEPEA